jgi:glycosyltransferase involved in cell wall biosynthesis
LRLNAKQPTGPISVCIDATPLTVATGGIRRYTEELAQALTAEFPEDRYAMISDQFTRPKSFLERRWWLYGVQREMKRQKADLFHGTDFSVPYIPLRPSVMTVHDLSPWREAGWHHAADRVRRRTPLLLRSGIATMVITPSEAVRAEAIAAFALNPDRVVAVPEAAGLQFTPQNPVRFVNEPYLLYVGTLEPRKNLGVVLEAWEQLRKEVRVSLVLAGRRRADFADPPPREGLHLLGAVEEDELPGLYSGAAAVVYPSLYEGFGLPVVEAMQCGAPVVTTLDPALVEVSGGAAMHVQAQDVRAWIAALNALLTDQQMRDYRRQLSLQRAKCFSWSETARRTREVYREAMRRF